MQLKKQAIRNSPTFDAVSCPLGIRRRPKDFNQRNNTHPTNNRGPQPRRRFFTPREMDILNSTLFDQHEAIRKNPGRRWS